MRVSNSLSEKIKQNITNSSLQSHNMMCFFQKETEDIYGKRSTHNHFVSALGKYYGLVLILSSFPMDSLVSNLFCLSDGLGERCPQNKILLFERNDW